MANQHIVLPGGLIEFAPGQNADFYNKYLTPSGGLFNKLYLRNIGHYPFNNEWNSSSAVSMAQIFYYMRCVEHEGRMNRKQILVLMMADFLGTSLSDHLFEAQNMAQLKLITLVSSLISKPDLLNAVSQNCTRATYDLATQHDNELPFDAESRRLFGVPALTDWPEATKQVIPDIGAAIRVLYFLAFFKQAGIDLNRLDLIVNTTVAISKRGTVSEGFIDKIKMGIRVDLQQNVKLDQEAMGLFYKRFGWNINDQSIQNIQTMWDRLIPTDALRFRLTLGQLAGSGMTAFRTIGKAMRKYPDFNWALVQHIFPHEFENFGAAINQVDGNVYWGFRHDLGAAKGTNFRSLAYVAKELLIKVGGEASLRQYAGWARRIPQQAAINLLIAEYETNQANQVSSLPAGYVPPVILNEVAVAGNDALFV